MPPKKEAKLEYKLTHHDLHENFYAMHFGQDDPIEVAISQVLVHENPKKGVYSVQALGEWNAGWAGSVFNGRARWNFDTSTWERWNFLGLNFSNVEDQLRLQELAKTWPQDLEGFETAEPIYLDKVLSFQPLGDEAYYVSLSRAQNITDTFYVTFLEGDKVSFKRLKRRGTTPQPTDPKAAEKELRALVKKHRILILSKGI